MIRAMDGLTTQPSERKPSDTMTSQFVSLPGTRVGSWSQFAAAKIKGGKRGKPHTVSEDEGACKQPLQRRVTSQVTL